MWSIFAPSLAAAQINSGCCNHHRLAVGVSPFTLACTCVRIVRIAIHVYVHVYSSIAISLSHTCTYCNVLACNKHAASSMPQAARSCRSPATSPQRVCLRARCPQRRAQFSRCFDAAVRARSGLERHLRGDGGGGALGLGLGLRLGRRAGGLGRRHVLR